MISYCKHCSRFIEASNSCLSMGDVFWRHVCSGIAACEFPIELDTVYQTYAEPICQPLFSPIDGTPLIWLSH